MRYITEGVVDTLNDFEKEAYILGKGLFPYIIVEKSDKYKLFKFMEDYSESVNMIKFVLSNLIKCTQNRFMEDTP